MNKTTIKRIGIAFGQFTGSIDEVAVYNRALSAIEVKDHYRAFVNKGGAGSPGAVKQYEGG